MLLLIGSVSVHLDLLGPLTCEPLLGERPERLNSKYGSIIACPPRPLHLAPICGHRVAVILPRTRLGHSYVSGIRKRLDMPIEMALCKAVTTALGTST